VDTVHMRVAAILTLQILGVRGIRDSDWFPGTGAPDCVVNIMCAGKLIGTTDVIADSLQPMEIEEAYVTEYIEGDSLEFKVYAKDGPGSDCLGRIALKPEQFLPNGFNEEVLLEDTRAKIEAYLSLKIKPRGKKYPTSPRSIFTVEVEKGEHTTYGLAIEHSDAKHIIVYGIKPGAFVDYNNSVEPCWQLKKSDFILSVNGESNMAHCLREFQTPKVTVLVARGIELTFILERENLRKPLELAFPAKLWKQGYGLPITRVGITNGVAKEDSRCAGEWDKLQAHDRIVSVNGETGPSFDLRAKIENMTGKFQVRILRACSEMKGSDNARNSDEVELRA